MNNLSLPLVSIVTPSYNQGNFIRETIESVLTQDYPNIEYWVIDGGSTDETIYILKEYEKDPRFHWISEKDRGQSDAINKGWSRCKGEILAWLNSDDTYLPDAINTQVKALLCHKECGAVYGNGIFIDQNSKPIYKCYSSSYSVIKMLQISIPLQPTVFIYRSLFEKIGLLNDNFKYSMDSEYWIRASKVTDFWYEPQFIATYRLHQQSKTVANYNGFYTDWISIADAFFSDSETPDVYQKQKKQVYAAIYSRIATIEAENGSLLKTIKYLCKAIILVGVKPRNLKSLLLLVERLLPFNFTPKLVESWTYFRQKLNCKLEILARVKQS